MGSLKMSMGGTHRRAAVRGLAGMAVLALVTPALAAAPGITIPKGTALELVLLDRLGTVTAKVGDKFRTRLARALYVDGQPALPKDTLVEGRVVLVKSPRDGGLSGVIGVEFVSLRPAGGHATDIHGKLTSLRQDDRRRMVELAPKVSTGRHIDVVFIGRSSAGRASTLVGDDLAEAWSHSGLSPTDVEIAAGTQVAMELDEPVMAPPAMTPPAVMGVTAASDVQYIYVSPGTVASAQQALSERKYYDGEADGQLGVATRYAIIRFQLDHEQVATGDLDEATLPLLGLPPSPRR
jgi:hypothetical protein